MREKRSTRGTTALLVLLTLLILCPALLHSATPTVRLATTTSTENSGLLNYLLPRFEQRIGYKVHVIAVGTGKALRMARDGDVDLVLVHAKQAEEDFVEAGYGERRHQVMSNDFVIVGPSADPAGIAQVQNVELALQRVSETQSLFISRGDDSGTHKKELDLWRYAGITPNGDWYREAGQSMSKVLQIADQLDAYSITDRGTWLALQEKLSLKIGFEGAKILYNPYGIIAVSAKRFPDINHEGAMALIEWITSAEGQTLIGEFKVAGQRLFIPDAKSDRVSVLQRDKRDITR